MLRRLCEFKWYFDIQINVIKVTFKFLIKKKGSKLSNNMFLILAMGVDDTEWNGLKKSKFPEAKGVGGGRVSLGSRG